MDVQGAVVRGQGQPFELATLQLDEPRPDEVRVKITASGVCHTDAIVRDQVYPTPLPAVLGHEGAGIVEAVGSDVDFVAVGDHVVLGFNHCGVCRLCRRGRPAYCEYLYERNFGGTRPDGSVAFSEDGKAVSSHFFGQSSFASHVNAARNSVVKVPDEVPLELLGPLGCGFGTGAGAILNSFGVRPGDTVAVFGSGAVGSAAIMAAAAVGAGAIVAVDLIDSRLEVATELGATHTVNSKTDDLAAAVADITGGIGLDFALDCTGIPAVTRQAADSLGKLGTAGLVGAPPFGAEASFEIGESLMKGWRFQTIIEGDAIPQDFIPRMIGLWRQGRFPLEKLVKSFPIADINEAFDASARGEVIKPILTF
ncbi:aryl-alcohol dehydrogenase [Stackebrandtia endophytica]|uniref:Aryl-alcohol dehydrogenase n=1 Tax=Stackebrandtia endophytica TaxID=1496996 RepID=A0A543AUE6_9ACTN|nr:NAD(P)-dependent alcohol dehydrogenase [Stackebrandtia endophytica]TQL76201.1 aryl-alcohol dehydrogenase [Stackebrandtia endophytica]